MSPAFVHLASAPAPRPHAVAVAFPAQGHINPMMQLCKTLALNGFTVTIVYADYIYDRLLDVRGEPDTKRAAEADGLDIRSAHLPVPGIDFKKRSSISFSDLIQAIEKMGTSFEQLIEKLSTENPPPTCIIADLLMPIWTHDVANKYKIPIIAFMTFCQTVNLLIYYLPLIVSNGQLTLTAEKSGFQASNADGKRTDSLITGFSGLPPLKPVDIPTFIHNGDSTAPVYHFLARQFDYAKKARRVFVNTFYELEGAAIDAMSEHFPVSPVGPLLPRLSSGRAVKNNGTSLWDEQHECLQWLDQQPSRSVLYVSFGSIAVLNEAQFQETILGLEATHERFLFVLRPGLVKDSFMESPEYFVRGRGYNRSFFVSWAPQLLVLSHSAIGGFLTHCGWNSTLEAIYNGVPMVGSPYFADQMMDCKLIVEEWKVGMDLRADADGVVRKEEVERVVRELMKGERGKELRERAANLRDAARKNLQEGGISHNNLKDFIEEMYALV